MYPQSAKIAQPCTLDTLSEMTNTAMAREQYSSAHGQNVRVGVCMCVRVHSLFSVLNMF